MYIARCPHCWSHRIENDGYYETDGETLWYYTCVECGYEWKTPCNIDKDIHTFKCMLCDSDNVIITNNASEVLIECKKCKGIMKLNEIKH